MGGEPKTTTPADPPKKRRTHRHKAVQYAVLILNVIVIIGCFIGSGALVYGQHFLSSTKKTTALDPTSDSGPPIATDPTPETATATPGTGSTLGTDGGSTTSIAPVDTTPFPTADPQARNFLITGSDNHACSSANSAYPVDPRGGLGERSDTIMVMRVDPSTSRAAVLSFPRDLWVKIHGTNGKNRINAAYSVNQPQKLIDTIKDNFGISIDHYIQIDFCAFKDLVDSVGGVSVPFTYPARDKNTGLDVPNAGCFNFNGDAALAYVRSRHYQYLNPKTGKWTEDPLSDFGRISRQQDFLRRAVAKVLAQGTFNLSVAKALINVAEKYVVTDPDLTIEKQLQFAGVLKALNPDDLQTYQIETASAGLAGISVLNPLLNGANMKAILAIFRGKAQLATAPAQVFDTTTTFDGSTTTTAPAGSSTAATGSTVVSTTLPATTTTTKKTGPTTTLPAVDVSENAKGIVPPKNVKC